jgi:hypothetical protein
MDDAAYYDEERWYRGGEMVDGEWSYSMLPFQGEESKGQRLFQKGKGACKVAFGSHTEGRPKNAAVSSGIWIGLRWKTTSRVSWAKRLFGSVTVVEIKHAAKIEWARKKEIFGPKENCEEEFGLQ